MKDIIQLKVSLLYSKPLIWRRLLINSNTTFFELHHIIQIAMGWQNYHLFEFNLEGYRIGEIQEEEDYSTDKLLDDREIKLSDIIIQQNETFSYLYDFGDDWVHQIIIEKFIEIDDNVTYPICIDGDMDCPPEDCGGIDSFYNYLNILRDKEHPDYKEIKEWMGRKYKAKDFDKEKVTRQLKDLDKYIEKWLQGEE